MTLLSTMLHRTTLAYASSLKFVQQPIIIFNASTGYKLCRSHNFDLSTLKRSVSTESGNTVYSLRKIN